MTELNKFLDAVCLEPDENTAYVFCVQKKPIKDNHAWSPLTERGLTNTIKHMGDKPYSAYISTQISKKDSKGEYRNKKGSFHSLNMVILDDIGTKVSAPALEPTFKIESSEGNYQWGYVFDSPVEDLDLASRIIKTVYGSGATDGGGALTGKYVRLPCGVNNKLLDDEVNMFPVGLVELNDVYFTVDELISGLGLTLSVDLVSSVRNMDLAFGFSKEDKYLDWISLEDEQFRDDQSEWVTITCPWHESHSPGGGITAGYSPLDRIGEGRSFKCFHDHCSERGIDDYLRVLDKEHGVVDIRSAIASCVSGDELLTKVLPAYKGTLNKLDLEVAAQKSKLKYLELEAIRMSIGMFRDILSSTEPADNVFKSECDNWAYIQYDDTLFNPSNGKLISPKVFDRMTASYNEGESSLRLAMESNYIRQYYQTMYVPWMAKEFNYGELDYLNTYKNHWIDPALRCPTSVDSFKRHLDNAIPDKRLQVLFINFLAHIIKGESRVKWAVLLQGKEGDGKGFFSELMNLILGENSTVVSNNEVNSSFNDWASGFQFTNLNEIKMAGAYKETVANALKSAISDDVISIIGKGVKGRKAINTASYLITTNYRDALPINVDSRRYLYIFNENKRRDSFYYDEIFDDMRAGVLDIKEYLLSVGIHKDFNPLGRAPDSIYKDETIKAMENPIDEVIDCEIEAGNMFINDRFVVVKYIRNSYELEHETVISSNKISSRLHNIGYIKQDRMEFNGEKLSLWSKHSNLERGDVRDYLEVRKLEMSKIAQVVGEQGFKA